MKLKAISLCLLVLLHCAGLCAAEELPSINEVLTAPDNYPGGIIEVRDDLSAYNLYNTADVDFGDYKMIILQRVMPLKAFTAMDSGYPDNYVSGFPEDFVGEDLGSPRIYVRLDIMAEIPEYYRAGSLEEADVLVIAENEYDHAGTISVSDFSGGYDPDDNITFDTPEEFEAYIQENPKVITAITYYPKFCVYDLVDLYSTKSKSCIVYDYQLTDAKRFARNPEASDLWGEAELLMNVIDYMTEVPSSLSGDDVLYLFGDTVYIPESGYSAWASCLDNGEYDAAVSLMNDYFWQMAQSLIALDDNENHQATMQMLVENRDAERFAMAVSFFDYSGFDTPIADIGEDMEYIAETDTDWLEETLQTFAFYMNQ